MLTDVPEPQLTKAEQDALMIRQTMADLTGHAAHALTRIRQLVRDSAHRQAVVDVLGPADAKALRNAFAGYRAGVQAAREVDVGGLEA